MSQLKGNFYILRDGTVLPDERDMHALSTAWFANPSNPRSYNSFTELADPEIEFCACLWEIDAGVKACVTDRESNMLELLDVSIATAARVLREAILQRAVTPGFNNNPENGWTP